MGHKTKVLLLVGGAPYHDKPEHREILSALLGSRFDVTMADDAEVLTPENLDSYDVIADYTSWWEPTEEQCRALLDAVAGGKGYFCMHPATASFMNSFGYHEMVGGTFIEHDPNKLFTVKIDTAKRVEKHPITQDVGDFEIQDELFVVDGNQTEWNILARAEGHPVLWTKEWGKGRVHTNVLGHDERALNNPSLRTLIILGVEWVAGLR